MPTVFLISRFIRKKKKKIRQCRQDKQSIARRKKKKKESVEFSLNIKVIKRDVPSRKCFQAEPLRDLVNRTAQTELMVVHNGTDFVPIERT